MDILKLIKILRDKFSKNRFFVRVYHIENDIIIYNDVDIVLKYDFGLFKNIDKAGKIVVLPLTYFYPYPNFDKDKVKGNDYKKYITEETICIHLWDSRWN